MQKENVNGFKLFQGKSNSPFTAFNLTNQSIPESNIFPTNLSNQIEELSRTQKGPTKTKIIQKAKDKEETKRYDRGGNCVASNTSKLFIKILNKRLARFPVVEQYLNFYQIYSQKQNILLIPLCLYSFLKQYEHSVHNRFHSSSQVAHPKHNTQQKFNTRQIYSDIITELKDHIQCSLQNSRTKYKDCSDSKKQFHLKNISIYNKISDIIKKVEQLAFGLDDTGQHKSYQKQQEKCSIQNEGVQKSKNSSSNEISSDIKIEQEQLHYNQFQQKILEKSVQSSSNLSTKPQAPYQLQTFQSPLESLYERKQREYQKAMDKVYSVIMNQHPLRELFHIYKLDVQQILIESVNYCYRRNINSRVKKNQKIIKDIYEKLQIQLLDALQIKDKQSKQFYLKGWEFIIVFLTLQVAGDKKAQIYEQFKQNIKRKTKYFNLTQNASANDPKQAFDNQYYKYSLRILEQHYQSQTKRKKEYEKDNSRQLYEKMKEWIIGYYFNSTVNKICTQQPKFTPRISVQESAQSNKIIGKPYLHHFTHPIILTTFNQKTSQVKKQQEFEKTTSLGIEDSRKGPIFGLKEQKALQRLMVEFQNLSKQNYENFY